MKDVTDMEGVEDTTGAVIEAETEAAATKNGVSDEVDSAQNVRRAGEVARSVSGVRSVKNDLIVK
jgi:osmotically-inducible protein OsmY